MRTSKKGAGQPSAGLRPKYRFLKKGEKIRVGDVYRSVFDGKRVEVTKESPCFGKMWDPDERVPIRRRIQSPKGSAKRVARSRPKSSPTPQSIRRART